MTSLLSLGTLLDRAWEHYRTRFSELMRVQAWSLIVIVLNIIALFFYPLNAVDLQRALTPTEWFGLILFVVTNLIVGVIVQVWVTTTLIQTISQQLDGKTPNPEKTAKAGWAAFPSMIWLLLELAVLYGIALILPLGIYWLITHPLAGYLSIGALLALAFLALVLFIPPFAFLIYFAFARFALLEDQQKGTAAIRASAELLRNRFWPVCVRLVLPKVLYLAVWTLGQVVLLTLFSVFTIGSGQEQTALGLIAAPTTYFILFVLINPLLLVTDQLIYRNLKA